MAAAAFVLVHPVLDRALLEANALPSRLAHPAWLEAWACAGAGLWQRLLQALQPLEPGAATLHRHVSGALLRDPALDLGWIAGLDDPALPLCLAPPPLFEALQRRAGLVLLGPAIRQVIVRSELARIEQRLGAPALDFVRQQAPRLWAGLVAPARLAPAEVEAQVMRWGAALLARALDVATPPVARRGRLRLAPAEGSPSGSMLPEIELPATVLPATVLPENVLGAPQALSLARALLQELDPPWFSHFPALR